MGLPVSITVRGPGARTPATHGVVQGVYAELRHADRVFSTYRSDSEVSLLRAGALHPSLLSPDVALVRDLCDEARVLTGGWFDAGAGTRWDPSGLVKGWAVERAARALAGCGDWLVNAGGDLLGSSTGDAWRVAVEHPSDRARQVCVLPLRAGAVATSGTAARGRHLLDPRTGAPVADHLLSATVVGPSLLWADVLATACFVEGPASLDRLAALPGHELLLVLPDGSVQATAGLLGRV